MIPETTIVLTILAATVLLLILDILPMDLVALLCMLALGWTGILAPLESLSGFSSNAVIAMIAVMVLGKGLEKTGVTDRFARVVARFGGQSAAGITALVSAAAGLTSAVIQNIGAAALFLPAILSISRRMRISPSRLIMPIGFAAILGGTLTMVGSGPLILTNDLLASAALEPYNLLAVTPVGVVLLISCIALFFLFGPFLLPRREAGEEGLSLQKELIEAWRLPPSTSHWAIPEGSPMVGKNPEEMGIWDRYQLHILAVSRDRDIQYAPWRNTRFEANQELSLLGDENSIALFASDFGLLPREKLVKFRKLSDPEYAGFAEVVIPPRSGLVGRTIRDFGVRKRYAVEPVILFHDGENIRGDFSDLPIKAGDTLIVHGLWENILELRENRDFVVITPMERGRRDRSRAWIALVCFFLAILLALTGSPISTAFLSGAAAMALAGVLSMEEIYKAVDWKVVFFLAGLIPLGIAMQKTGTAELVAGSVMGITKGSHPLLLLFAVAILSTIFSLVMSNVASTVILAPLVISMAQMANLDPRPLVLLVAVSAANSFILPTHQVNALLRTPGGYNNADYLKAGGGMTVLFVLTVVPIFYLFYL
ncbi:MAG: SLC13 family permease [Proteobacteria bacterium]|nr:SLC13 family permease [Pseudomonadota bacterium]